LAISRKVDKPRAASDKPMSVVDTPGQHTIESLSQFLKINPARTIKTLLVRGVDDIVALVIRGDHELNAVKAEKLPQVQKPLSFATAEEVQRATGCEPGSIGPVGLKLLIIADPSAAQLSDFVCGANEEGKHLQNVNWGRDTTEPKITDIRDVVQGDPCPRCDGILNIRRGIEVGHVFQLGTKYSESMGASVLDEAGETVNMSMGCYGIGVSRVVAAAIEQNHDENGIIWPGPIAPFDLCLVPIGINKSTAIAETSEKLYRELRDAGIDVLFDDRNERPGVMFADMDLVGIPHRLVLGERGLKNGVVEYKSRREKATSELPLSEAVKQMRQYLNI
ncbi:MAG: proline--tRNA ligase, partial [Acidiferrobacterales bacterium]